MIDLDFAKLAEEPLHPDLERWIEGTSFGPALKHPLVFSVPLAVPGLANLQYEHKTKALEKANANQDWHTIVWLHERPYRFEAMSRILWFMDESDRYSLVRDVWIDSENIWQHYEEWIKVLEGLDDPQLLMYDDEREVLRDLPETARIYRGARLGVNEEGLSWTMDHDRAKWFARRLTREDDSVVIHADVSRDDIVAIFESRSENEVVALPHHVSIDHYEEV